MKRIYLLFMAVALAACSAEPVETEGINSLDAAIAGKQVQVQNTKLAYDIPTLTLGEGTTENELEVVVTPGETGAFGGFRLRWMTAEDYATSGWGDDEELAIEMCQEMFQVNGNNADYSLASDEEFSFFLGQYIDNEGESCQRALSCGMEYVFKVEALNSSGKDGLQKSGWSEIYYFSTTACPEIQCESGYMIGDKNFDEIGPSKNWGWAHNFNFSENGFETRDIYHKNGSLEGDVTIAYANGLVTITEGTGVTITHLYISNEEPTDTNAPGQFDKTQQFEDEDGSFWVIIKAEVCE